MPEAPRPIVTPQISSDPIEQDRLAFEQLYVDPGSGKFLDDVVEGLSRRPKRIPYVYFYDAEGSKIFEEITRLPEYYLTSCEDEILSGSASDIIEQAGRPGEIVEFGSGSAAKTRRLLEAALDRRREVCFVPIDISGKALMQAAKSLIHDFDRLFVRALAAEYEQGLAALSKDGPTRLFLFMGSSIGNLSDNEAAAFFHRIREVARPVDRLLIGADLAKEPSVIEEAYNDSQGVTARFNLNTLARINRELGGEFDLAAFKHEAPYQRQKGRVEMRLISRKSQSVRVGAAERTFEFREDEHMWTERCRKYTEDRLGRIVRAGGFETVERWHDSKCWFTVRLLQPA